MKTKEKKPGRDRYQRVSLPRKNGRSRRKAQEVSWTSLHEGGWRCQLIFLTDFALALK